MKSDPENNYVSVCENKCSLSEEDSTAQLASCNLPSISTTYSDANFEIQTPHKLSGVWTSSNNDHAKLVDGNIHTQNSDWNADCHATMELRAGYIGTLDKIRYFLPADMDKETYFISFLKFQGSDDGTTFTDLFEVDSNARSGWNTVEWDDPATKPASRYFRFKGSTGGACIINEVEITGVESILDSNAQYTCSPKLVVNGVETTLTGSDVVYDGALTTALDEIAPRYGDVAGGDSVTFTGTDFSDQVGDYLILIDGVTCAATAATTTSVTCDTGPRIGIVEGSLSIHIAGKGEVSLKGNSFQYVNAWSADTTWGGEFAPLEGESIYIPKGLNLLVDIDSTPQLNAIIVEGTLIIAPDVDPTHHRTLDAHYIFVNGGRMEVGTEAFPYTSKITITMHGDITSPYLPTYGNKVLGVRHGTLDMHGPERSPTWTLMETTAEPGATQITLRTAVDWMVGEQISIAPTSYEAREAEPRYITAIDRTDPHYPVLTLDRPLEFKHFAAT
jgi:hypothetical protein